AAGPAVLRAEEHADEAVEPVGRSAARENRRLHRRAVEREVAEDELGLARVDPFGLELGQRVALEGSAMRAGQRGVFDDGDRGVRLAENAIVRADRRRGVL